MKEPKPLRELCEERARAGDGVFAVAAALFDLSDSQEATSKAIQRLGNGNASTPYGAIENLAMQFEKSSEALSQAIDGVGHQIAIAISSQEN